MLLHSGATCTAQALVTRLFIKACSREQLNGLTPNFTYFPSEISKDSSVFPQLFSSGQNGQNLGWGGWVGVGFVFSVHSVFGRQEFAVILCNEDIRSAIKREMIRKSRNTTMNRRTDSWSSKVFGS